MSKSSVRISGPSLADATEQELREHFAFHGEVIDLALDHKQTTAHIKFASTASAHAALLYDHAPLPNTTAPIRVQVCDDDEVDAAFRAATTATDATADADVTADADATQASLSSGSSDYERVEHADVPPRQRAEGPSAALTASLTFGRKLMKDPANDFRVVAACFSAMCAYLAFFT